MVVPIPLGQRIEVAAYGVVVRHLLVSPHHGAHQIGLAQPDASMLHLHQQRAAQRLVEHLPGGTTACPLTQLVLAAQAVEAHVVVFGDVLLGAEQG